MVSTELHVVFKVKGLRLRQIDVVYYDKWFLVSSQVVCTILS